MIATAKNYHEGMRQFHSKTQAQGFFTALVSFYRVTCLTQEKSIAHLVNF